MLSAEGGRWQGSTRVCSRRKRASPRPPSLPCGVGTVQSLRPQQAAVHTALSALRRGSHCLLPGEAGLSRRFHPPSTPRRLCHHLLIDSQTFSLGPALGVGRAGLGAFLSIPAPQLTGGLWTGVGAARTVRRRRRRTRMAMARRLLGGPGPPLTLALAHSLQVGECAGSGGGAHRPLPVSAHRPAPQARALAGLQPLTQCLGVPHLAPRTPGRRSLTPGPRP